VSSVAGKFELDSVDAAKIDARIRVALLVACPLLFALIAVLMGKATGWDLRNYHWYNPYAFLNGRLGFDVAVGHHASYYNPIADVPFFLIASNAPAWMAGAFLGALAGIAVALVGAVAYSVLHISNERQRLLAASLIALIGATGAGACVAIGDPYNDIPAGIGMLIGLLTLVGSFDALRGPRLRARAVAALAFAGVASGAAVALKLTTAPYACGMAAALVVTSGSAGLRAQRAIWFGAGAAAGLSVLGGNWMLSMWHYGSNPLFPYFNNIFHSNLLLNADYRDPNFHPDSLRKFLSFPLDFTVNSQVSSEQSFRDAHLLAVYVVIPLTAVVAAVTRLRRRNLATDVILPARSAFVLTFASVTYVAWIAVFAIYRYMIPFEMLTPLLLVAAIMIWPIRLNVRIATIALILIGALAVERVSIQRDSWSGPYVDVEVPELQDPEHAMVLMSGYEPMAFVIPSFPAAVPFLRIDGWLASADDYESGLARGMRERVAAHNGPLYLLFSPIERDHAVLAVKGYDLSPALDTGCTEVKSNIAEPLQLCRVYKLKP
jgi:hypothetical protein